MLVLVLYLYVQLKIALQEKYLHRAVRRAVREGDMPPPAQSAEAFDTIQVLKH